MTMPRDDVAAIRNGEPFHVSVEFLSDWSCSTGTTRHGSLDREIQRDVDGWPMVRGKTLAAMLRDAAETIAAGMDEGSHGRWHAWVDAVFGRQRGGDEVVGDGDRLPELSTASLGPRAAALEARPLRLADSVRSAVGGLDEFNQRIARSGATVVRPGVRIDPISGTAVDDMLRIDELACAGLTVSAQWRLTFTEVPAGQPVPWEAELLLRGAARLVDSIGGKRRRGAGRCAVRITTDESLSHVANDDRLEDLLSHVEEARWPSSVLVAPTAGGTWQANGLGVRSTDRLRHRCDLRITAVTPLLVLRGETSNSARSEPFVPGTALLPIVAQALGSRSTELITGGGVVVTDATIEIDGRRSVPLPQALHGPKDDDGQRLVNVLYPTHESRLKPRAQYCVEVDHGLLVASPTMVTQAHAVIDDRQQRPNKQSGGFYVYQALAAGTVLRAEVWLPDGVPLDTDVLRRQRALGRSKKDDYGQIIIEVCPPGPPLTKQPPRVRSDRDELARGDLIVWLLSDLLLRGEAGEPVPHVERLAQVLGDALQVSLAIADPRDMTAPSVLVTTRRVESWHSRWSLPRPSLVGLTAGSVIRFSMEGEPDLDGWQRLEAHGIGERTAEGFGRIALQPQLLLAQTVHAARAEKPRPTRQQSFGNHPAAAAAPNKVVDSLLLRGWHLELRHQAVSWSQSSANRRLFLPAAASQAQLGTLRNLAERMAAGEDGTELLAWIKGLSPDRRDSWNRDGDARVDRLGRLEKLVVGEEDVFSLLELAGRPPQHLASRLRRLAVAWLIIEAVRSHMLGGTEDLPQRAPKTGRDSAAFRGTRELQI